MCYSLELPLSRTVCGRCGAGCGWRMMVMMMNVMLLFTFEEVLQEEALVRIPRMILGLLDNVARRDGEVDRDQSEEKQSNGKAAHCAGGAVSLFGQ